ncbi:UNVERIFIED_CONTAM: hypothetical protein FKN15_037517 [Acipenser sinensis]
MLLRQKSLQFAFPILYLKLPVRKKNGEKKGDMGGAREKKMGRRRKTWEEPEHLAPEWEEPEHPAPEWEEPVRPKPKRGESVRPEPKRGESVRPEPEELELPSREPEGEKVEVPQQPLHMLLRGAQGRHTRLRRQKVPARLQRPLEWPQPPPPMPECLEPLPLEELELPLPEWPSSPPVFPEGPSSPPVVPEGPPAEGDELLFPPPPAEGDELLFPLPLRRVY